MICPSSDRSSGTMVIGIRRPGRLPQRLNQPIPVPVELRSAEWADRHVRFAGPCHGSKCSQWELGCSVGRTVATSNSTVADGAGTECAIRRECRWYAENGEAACRGCGAVIRVS